MTKRIKTPKPGQQIRAKELERMARLVQNHEKRLLFSGIGHGIEGHNLSSAGLSWRNNRYIPFWAKITGNSAAASTTLNGAINDSVTSITVASASGFPTSGYYLITIDSEIMEVTAGQGTVNWTVTRGVVGTTKAAHANGATVSGYPRLYQYTEQAMSMPGTFIDATYPREGTANKYPAFEVNGMFVPTGTYVLMWLGYDGLIGSYCLFDYQSSFYLSVSNVTLSTNQNDYALASGLVSWLRINATADITITGIAGGVDGRLLKISNVGTNSIKIPHQSGSSSAPNRVYTPDQLNDIIRPGEERIFNYVSSAGSVTNNWMILGSYRHRLGVTEISSSPYTLSSADHLKHLVWTGSGTLVLNEPVTLPYGFRCLIRNDGAAVGSLLEYTRNSGTKDAIPPSRGYIVSAPDFDDSGTTRFSMPGLTFYGGRSISANDNVTRADLSRCLELTGAGATLTLFQLNQATYTGDYSFGFAVKNNGSGSWTIARSGSDTINGATSLTLRTCEGVWIFAIAANTWIAVTGKVCSPLTTKGDIWVYSTTEARLAVGSNDQVLTADSTQATGLKWATPSVGTDKGVRVYRTTTQTITTGATDAITWVTEDYDTDTMWTGGSATRITFTTAGKYYVMYSANVDVGSDSTIKYLRAGAYLNGAGTAIVGSKGIISVPGYETDVGSETHDWTLNCAFEINAAASDYIELKIYNGFSGSASVLSAAIQARKVDKAS